MYVESPVMGGPVQAEEGVLGAIVGCEERDFEFAKKIRSLERLKLLFIFTIADMKATGKSIWNTWNKLPLEQLFIKTRNLLIGSSINANKEIIENIKLKRYGCQFHPEGYEKTNIIIF